MERPDLYYNYYYPYYTQKITGKKKYFYSVVTIMHLSHEKGIVLSLQYKENKIAEVKISELTNINALLEASESRCFTHYVSFAEEVNKAYCFITGALNKLSSCKPYVKKIMLSSYFKHNCDIEFELKHKEIRVSFGKLDYVIEDGQQKKNESDAPYMSETMEKVKAFLSVVDAQITYTELDPAVFDKELNYYWEYFIEFFKCPKFIKKSEYQPK